MLCRREIWATLSKRLTLRNRLYCTKSNRKNGESVNELQESYSSSARYDAYKQLENLDLTTAAKILFTAPPTKKKFGIDFHLVQLVVVCLPSLAIYLLAQYARHEMRKMDAELHAKKQAEEEAKAKEIEQKAEEEKRARSGDILEVKERLHELEQTVKAMALDSKKHSDAVRSKTKGDDKKLQTVNISPSNISSQSNESTLLSEHELPSYGKSGTSIKEKTGHTAPVSDVPSHGSPNQKHNGGPFDSKS